MCYVGQIHTLVGVFHRFSDALRCMLSFCVLDSQPAFSSMLFAFRIGLSLCILVV